MNENKIVLKIVIIALEFIVAGIILSYRNVLLDKYKDNSNIEYEEQIFKNNSYYTDTTFMVENIYRENTIKKFIEYIFNSEYENAFGMLTSECKMDKFEDNIEQFQKEFLNKLNNINDDYTLELISEQYNEKIGLATYSLNLNSNVIEVIVEDNGPFDQKINLNKF